MLLKRLLVALVFLPFFITITILGGPVFKVIITGFLAIAAWELANLLRLSGFKPAYLLLIAGTVVLALDRAIFGFENTPWLISLIILMTLTYHLVSYEKGDDQAPINFSITLAGIVYLGFIGSYLISIRELPDGKWWLLVVFAAIWLVDAAAYVVGSRWGSHKMSPRLSPRKSWEGYIAGVLVGIIGTTLVVKFFGPWLGAPSVISIERAAIIGLVMGAFPFLGDLGESMFKRQAGAKDSGSLFPGHGGAFDRFDSWLWAGVLGYYLVVWFLAA